MEYLNWIGDHEGFVLVILLMLCLTYALPKILRDAMDALSEIDDAKDD